MGGHFGQRENVGQVIKEPSVCVRHQDQVGLPERSVEDLGEAREEAGWLPGAATGGD